MERHINSLIPTPQADATGHLAECKQSLLKAGFKSHYHN